MKYFIAFLVGAVSGAVTTYLYFNNKTEKIVDERVNNEMENFLKHQTETLSEDDVIELKEEEIVEEPEYSEIPDTTEKTSIVKMEEIIRTNYRDNDGIEEDEDDEEYITDEEMEELMLGAEKRMADNPQIVTEEESQSMYVGYDNEEYIWYPKENFITDTMDNRLEEQDLLDILFKPIDWRKELKDKEKIIVRVSSEATYYTVWNKSKVNW